MAQQFASSKNALNKRLCEPPYHLSAKTLEKIRPDRMVPSRGRARRDYVLGLAHFILNEVESPVCRLPLQERIQLLCQALDFCLAYINEEG